MRETLNRQGPRHAGTQRPREERRVEEAPAAYKPIGPVLAAQEQAGLIEAVVRLKPWVTFKA